MNVSMWEAETSAFSDFWWRARRRSLHRRGRVRPGPCSQEIDRVQTEIDAKLGARAAAGPSARESCAAKLRREPTPGSIAAAETRLGDVSSQKVEAVAAAMARAREADEAGHQSACEQALVDVQRALGCP